MQSPGNLAGGWIATWKVALLENTRVVGLPERGLLARSLNREQESIWAIQNPITDRSRLLKQVPFHFFMTPGSPIFESHHYWRMSGGVEKGFICFVKPL